MEEFMTSLYLWHLNMSILERVLLVASAMVLISTIYPAEVDD